MERIRASKAQEAGKPKQSRKGGGAGKQKRPLKKDSQPNPFVEAQNMTEAIALLEKKKAQRRIQKLTDVLQSAMKSKVRLRLDDLHKSYQSDFPEDDTHAFHVSLKQVDSRLVESVVKQETLWESTKGD